MAILFISDLHLDSNHPETTQIFLNLLQETNPAQNTLYILGDFFESWIGDDNLSEFNLKIIHALKKATDAGLPIYFLHGNRDFLLGKKFFRMTGCRLLPDETIVNIFGIPVLLMHGDTLCTEDKAYLKFRKKARNWFFQKLFLLKSLKKRKAIADQYREASQKYIATAPEHIMDVTPDEVIRVMKKHQVQHLIHGHTHRQAIHPLTLNHQSASRTVLGAWHSQGNAFICRENGEKSFHVL